MFMNIPTIIQKMEMRRKNLGISHRYLAQVTGISVPTVQRIFSGKSSSTSFETVVSLASVLGMAFYCEPRLAEDEVLVQAARRRAHQLALMMQATSTGSSNLLDTEGLAKVEDKLVLELLKGSRARIWAAS